MLSGAVTEGLVHDVSALAPDADLDTCLRAFETEKAGPLGDVLASFAVLSSAAEALRPLVDPEGHQSVALVSDGGLLALQEARHAIQDDTWLDLDHLRIALPTGFEPREATRALLDELAFTAPTYVELPRTGYETALDVLGLDGAEGAAFSFGGAAGGDPLTDGEVASAIHGCVDRRVQFYVSGGLDEPVRTPGSHGVLNVLAATAAAVDGATTSAVAALVESHDTRALLAVAAAVPGRDVRARFRGFGTTDARGAIAGLVAAGVISSERS